jgi:hypothetical protein
VSPCGDPDKIWEHRYESLRHAATATDVRPWGLSVMVMQGMAAWMLACPQADQAVNQSDTSASSGRSSSAASTHSPNEVASIMTDMILSSCLNRAI